MAVEIVLVAHSTTTDNEAGIATGWMPGALSAIGREQATALGARHPTEGFDAIYVSDLHRAVETASIPYAGHEVHIDARLRECNYGVLNGMPAANLARAEHTEVPFPDGESYRDVVERTRAFLYDATGRVLVIAHSPTATLSSTCSTAYPSRKPPHRAGGSLRGTTCCPPH